ARIVVRVERADTLASIAAGNGARKVVIACNTRITPWALRDNLFHIHSHEIEPRDHLNVAHVIYWPNRKTLPQIIRTKCYCHYSGSAENRPNLFFRSLLYA